MGNYDENLLVVEVSGELIKNLAPYEMPMYKFVREAYLKNPESGLKQSKKRDDMLGFGVNDVVGLFTPIVLAALREVMPYLITIVKEIITQVLCL